MNRCLILFLSILALASCNKVTKYANTPKLSFNSSSLSQMKAGKDTTIQVLIDFQDGNGDVGFGTNNLFFIDTRKNDTVAYTIPGIPPRFEPKRGIKGTLQVDVLGATLLLRADTLHKEKDTLVWNVFMVDEANDTSNLIATDPLFLFK
jgi:hypothetical protein